MIKKHLNNLRHWIAHRTYDKYHVVDTGLPPGDYDIDTRMLHANFNLLKNYVEHECAWMQVVFDDEAWKKYGCTGRGWSSSLAGTDYLIDKIAAGNPTPQPDDWKYMQQVYEDEAKFAQEALDLYEWWTATRPARKDPWQDREGVHDLDPLGTEELYTKEDEENLIRLMKIRTGLWT